MYYVVTRQKGGFLVHDTKDGSNDLVSPTDLFYLVKKVGVNVVNLITEKDESTHVWDMRVINVPFNRKVSVKVNDKVIFTESYPDGFLGDEERKLLIMRGAKIAKVDPSLIKVEG